MSVLDGMSVLLVEDEYLIALDAQQILKDLGAVKVEIAPTFERAEKMAWEGHFNVVVLDVNLNGQLSFPIAEVVRQRGIPFIFASGYDLRERTSEFVGVPCVIKPYSHTRFRSALDAARSGTCERPLSSGSPIPR
jgi:DNA-binding response OmpR family regulator